MQSKTRIAYGPFNKTTCLSYQYNGSAPITAGIVTSATIYSWDPSSASSIPDVVGTGCITRNCTIKATGLTASTSYWIFFVNKLPEAVKIFTIYATSKAFCNITLAVNTVSLCGDAAYFGGVCVGR